MDHHVKKPAVVERLTNQLQRRRLVQTTPSLTKNKKGGLEDLGRAGRDVHEREKGEATLETRDS
jgi:hypothetical protein